MAGDDPMKGSVSHRGAHAQGWESYLPLLVLLGVTALAATARGHASGAGLHVAAWASDFMGFFFVVFAMLKLFDLAAFADGFQMYDLLAKPVRAYGYVYPFIELALGLGYLAAWRPPVVNAATVVVMTFGALGVINALRRGLDLHCACMGNILKVPLSVVALGEDLGMALMAGAMWALR